MTIKLAAVATAAVLTLGLASQAQAAGVVSPMMTSAVLNDSHIDPAITSGALPDTPAAHIDANTASSAFSGVVSINIRYFVDGAAQSFICSGTLVSARDVVTASHCIDTNGKGSVVDISQAYNTAAKTGADVRVIFNSNGTQNAVMTAVSVKMNPNYQGFNYCPDGSKGCLNDDIAVITLGANAPSTAKIYSVWGTEVAEQQRITMVGYGTSGDGTNGYYISPSFTTKRVGENYMEVYDRNDELGFTGAKEVWYADFDGAGLDTFCSWGLSCAPALANHLESGIGGGDSGGATFMKLANGEYVLIGNNTFSGYDPDTQVAGTFGTYFGGMLTSGYIGFLQTATDGRITVAVPEPETYALMLGGLALVGWAARRRKPA